MSKYYKLVPVDDEPGCFQTGCGCLVMIVVGIILIAVLTS